MDHWSENISSQISGIPIFISIVGVLAPLLAWKEDNLKDAIFELKVFSGGYWITAIFNIYLACRRFRGPGAGRPIGQVAVPLLLVGLPPSLAFTPYVNEFEPRVIFIGGSIAAALGVIAMVYAYVRTRFIN